MRRATRANQANPDIETAVQLPQKIVRLQNMYSKFQGRHQQLQQAIEQLQQQQQVDEAEGRQQHQQHSRTRKRH